MKLSFVIPAHNEEVRIADCLRAIFASIEVYKRQHTSGWETEIIVVNNASTDKTGDIASGLTGVRVVDEPHKGLVWARRAGSEASTGDLIAHVDADTLMPNRWVSTVIHCFENDAALLALSGPYIYYDVPWYTHAASRAFYAVGYFIDRLNKLIFQSGSMLQGGNFVLRRGVMEKIGGFNTSIEFYGEDVDIGRRVNKIGKVRWTFVLPMYSSGRRLMKEGIFRTGIVYALNYIWMTFMKKPFSNEHNDIRMESHATTRTPASTFTQRYRILSDEEFIRRVLVATLFFSQASLPITMRACMQRIMKAVRFPISC